MGFGSVGENTAIITNDMAPGKPRNTEGVEMATYFQTCNRTGQTEAGSKFTSRIRPARQRRPIDGLPRVPREGEAYADLSRMPVQRYHILPCRCCPHIYPSYRNRARFDIQRCLAVLEYHGAKTGVR